MKDITKFINEAVRHNDIISDEDIANYICFYIDDYSDNVPERGWKDLLAVILEAIKNRLEFHHDFAKRINPKREDIPDLESLLKIVDKYIKDLPRK